MSRSFGDNLSKANERTLADVRRSVWTAGFKGMGYGVGTGFFIHTVLRLATRGKLRLPGNQKPITFDKNTAFFSVMAGGALGSFVNATTTGKNEVHQMHEIFEIGKHDHRTPYQEAYDNAKNEGEDSNSRKKRILSRRKTMSQRLSEQTGLSDSHGGVWINEEMQSEERTRRSARQVASAKRLGTE